MTLITPPIALEPYKDEKAPLTTSVLSITETGMSDHNAPFESPVKEGLPSRRSKTLLPIPPPATSELPLIESELPFIPLVLFIVSHCTSSNIWSNVFMSLVLISSEDISDIDERVF